MKQLHLQIVDCIALSADNFLPHSGVKKILEEFDLALKRSTSELILPTPNLSRAFNLFFVHGPARSGKTHMTLRVYDRLLSEGKITRLITGGRLKRYFDNREARFDEDANEEFGAIQLEKLDGLVVDDADMYLNGIKEGESGPLVNLIEIFRQRGSTIFLVSGRNLEEFSFDDHIRSRLLAGWNGSILPPSESEVPTIIDLMARQRGLRLGRKRTAFLSRRLGRDFSAVESYFERLQQLAKIRDEKYRFRLLGDAL